MVEPSRYGRRQHRRSILILPQRGTHIVEQQPRHSVRNRAAEAAAHFEPRFVIARGEQQQRAVVLAFLADAPRMKQIVRDIFDRLALERWHRDEGQFRAGRLLRPRPA